MSVTRNRYGAIKRSKVNRDYRRTHLMGAIRRVNAGNAVPQDFGTRMKNALLRFFAVQVSATP